MTKEQQKAYMREYYRQHRKEILEHAKEKYATDENFRNAIKDNWKNYRATHKKEIAKKMKAYQSTRKESLSQYNANYYNDNKTKINTRRNKKRREEKIMVQD